MKTLRWMRTLAVLLLLLPGGLFSAEGCGSGGVVGGECASGYTPCDGECIDLRADSANCGKCANRCTDGRVCRQAVCAAETGGAAPGGASGDGGSGGDAGDGGLGGSGGFAGQAGAGGRNVGGFSQGGGSHGDGGDGGNGGDNGAGGDGGNGGDNGAGAGGAAGNAQGGAGAANPGGAAGNAQGGAGGAAGNAQGGTGAANPGGAAGNAQGGKGGAPTCDLPMVVCAGQCIDPNIDIDNCGGCFRPCSTELCQGGQCVGARAGHEVLLGMDYASVSSTSVNPAALLGNAIFYNIRAGQPMSWNILGFDPFASPTQTTVNTIVNQQAVARGRATGLRLSVTQNPVALKRSLNIQNYDVFLMYDQPVAPPGRLRDLGATVGDTLRAFAEAGGTVVILAGGSGTNEMWQFVQAADILPVTGMQPVPTGPPATTLYNVQPTDGVARGIASSFAARAHTAYWQIAPSSESVIVWQPTGPANPLPVVLHRTVIR